MRGELSDADHQALNRLVIEMAWRMDHDLGETIAELYTEDCQFSEGPAGSPMAFRREGREALSAFGGSRPTHLRRAVMNLRFVADGPAAATGTGLMAAFLSQYPGEPGTTLPKVVGEYTFRLVRIDGSWLFASVHFERLYEPAAPSGVSND